MSTTLPFPDWLIERYGSTWVVAPRLTPDHKRKDYTLAISPTDYSALEVEWEQAFYGAPLRSLNTAAPDLLAWARMMVESLDAPTDLDGGTRARMAAQGRAVIAKAEGR